MRRNLDVTALRAFAMVAESGGVTRAAGILNLTQSAVSMQVKRLEELLGQDLLQRAGRGIALTASGEQLLAYARRMVALNDEAVSRMTADEYEGEIVLGVPHDIVTPFIPKVLKRFASAFPRMRLQLSGSYTKKLLDQFERGEIDVIVTTEEGCGTGGITLNDVPLVWVGAPGGQAWRQRPLPLAFEQDCLFRPIAQRELDRSGLSWSMMVTSENTRTIEATVAADLAIHTALFGTNMWGMERISHLGALPELGRFKINLYRNPARVGAAYDTLCDLLTESYGDINPPVSQQPSRLSAAI